MTLKKLISYFKYHAWGHLTFSNAERRPENQWTDISGEALRMRNSTLQRCRLHRTIHEKICRCIYPVCLEVLSIYGFNLQVIENKLPRKVFEEKWSQHFRTLQRVKRGDTRMSCGIVMTRESRRDCWTVHLDNMGEPKESIELWWRNGLENVNFGYTRGNWRISRLNLVTVLEVDNNRVILGYRGNCFWNKRKSEETGV